VSNAYGVDKNLEFIDTKGDKLGINNQGDLQYAVFLHTQAALEDFLRNLQTLGKPVPHPLVLPNVEVRLVVSNTGYSYTPFTLGTSLSQVDRNLFKDLNTNYNISFSELQRLNNEYLKSGKPPHEPISYLEFEQIILGTIPDTDLIKHIFNALDVHKTGMIDFSAFAVGMSLLQTGNPEQRLWFAFRAYDSENIGAIKKSDVFEMMKTANYFKNIQVPDLELRNSVEGIFSYYDRDKDGKLQYEEFREAVMSNYITLNPFWTQNVFPKQNFAGFVDTVPCFQCGKKFIPKSPISRSAGARCDECIISSPSKPTYFRSA